MGIIAFWIVGSIIVGAIASSKGRSGFGYFLLSLVLSPILIGILAIGQPSLKPSAGAGAAQPTDATHVRCEKCAEFILPEANVCKHCGAPHVPDHAHLVRVASVKQKAASDDNQNLLIGIAFIVGLIVLGKLISG